MYNLLVECRVVLVTSSSPTKERCEACQILLAWFRPMAWFGLHCTVGWDYRSIV